LQLADAAVGVRDPQRLGRARGRATRALSVPAAAGADEECRGEPADDERELGDGRHCPAPFRVWARLAPPRPRGHRAGVVANEGEPWLLSARAAARRERGHR
jgi:hypothetical protein